MPCTYGIRVCNACLMKKFWRRLGRKAESLLTFDLDFADLLALGMAQSPSVMIFRLNDETPAAVIPRMLSVIQERRQELEEGAIIMVEDSRYRLRRLPVKEEE